MPKAFLCRSYLFKAFLLIIPLVLASCSETKNKEFSPEPTALGYVSVDRDRLFFQTFGSGEPMVVLHGGPGLDQNYLLPAMLELSKDYQMIFYDQRGSGRSLGEKITLRDINLDQFTQDLEKLRKALGLKTFILVGHSWGGLIALDYAAKHAENLSHLILMNSAPADYKGQQAFVREFTKKTSPIKNRISTLFQYKDFQKLKAQGIEKLYKDLFSFYFYQTKNAERLVFKINETTAQSWFKVREEMSKTCWLTSDTYFTLLPALKHLQVPTLVVHGNQDIVPAHTAEDIKHAIPLSQILYMEHCGHFPYLEKPQELFLAIRSFLKRAPTTLKVG